VKLRTLLTASALALALAVPAKAATFNYHCKVDGSNKLYSLHVDTKKLTLTWRGKRYSITEQNDIDISAKSNSWHAVGNGEVFDFCTVTDGGAFIGDHVDCQEDGWRLR